MSAHELSLAGAAVTAWVSAAFLAGSRERLAPERILLALWALGVVAIVGGRTHFLLNMVARGLIVDPVETLRFWKGLHAPGAILAVAVAIPFVLRVLRLPFWRTLDVVVPSMLLGVGVARVGCFLNGCCFGRLCDAFYCVRFPDGSAAFSFQQARKLVASTDAWSLPIHPFALYLAAAAILGAALGVWVRERRAYAGQAALVALAAYLLGAALLEPLRENYYATELSWAGHLQFTWLAWGMAVAGLVGVALGEAWLRPRGPRCSAEWVRSTRI